MSFHGFFAYHNLSFKIPEKKSWQSIVIYKKGYIVVNNSTFQRETPNSLLLYHSLDQLFPYTNTLYENGIGGENNIFPKILSEEDFSEIITNREIPISCAVLFNEKTNLLRIARNAFGLTPLFYVHIPNRFIAFSSDINDLLALEEIKPYLSPNSATIWKYLSLKHCGLPYDSDTFYNNIRSIVPGEIATFTADSVESDIYMRYKPNKWDQLHTVEEFGEEFRYLFKKSVERCVKGKQIIGAHLSGGLDSSSVSSMVRQIHPVTPIHVFFSETNSPLANEKHFSLEVANSIKATHHTIVPLHNDLETLILVSSIYGQPEQMALSPSFQMGLLRHSVNSNCDVLLTGHDGDGIVGRGGDFLNKLMEEENWDGLRVHLSNLAQNHSLNKLHCNWDDLSNARKEMLVFQFFFKKHFVSSIKDQSFEKAYKHITIAKKHFKIAPSKFIDIILNTFTKQLKKSFSKHPVSIQKTSFHEATIDHKSGFIGPHTRTPTRDKNLDYTDEILFSLTMRLNEEFYALAKHFQYSIRHPFYDPNLYELCLAVPDSVKFGNGLGRAHLRQAMKGILPESIRTRADKALFNLYAKDAALRLYDQGRDFLTNTSPVWDYVDKKKFFLAVKLLQNKNESNTHHLMTFFVNRTMYLAVWLFSIR